MKDFAVAEWRRACKTLESSRRLLESDSNSAASRAYYAAFHAITALFALRGQTFAKHSALRAAIHRELIHTDQWAKDLGEAFEYLVGLRETGDYGGLISVSGKDAKDAAEKAAQILEKVRSDCPELSQS